MCPRWSPGFNNPYASVDAYGKIRKKKVITQLAPKKEDQKEDDLENKNEG